MLSYGLMAGLLALIVDGIYLWLIRTQGNVDEPWRGVPPAGFTLVTYAPPGCPQGGHHIEGTIQEGGHVTSFICENGQLVSWSRR